MDSSSVSIDSFEYRGLKYTLTLSTHDADLCRANQNKPRPPPAPQSNLEESSHSVVELNGVKCTEVTLGA